MLLQHYEQQAVQECKKETAGNRHSIGTAPLMHREGHTLRLVAQRRPPRCSAGTHVRSDRRARGGDWRDAEARPAAASSKLLSDGVPAAAGAGARRSKSTAGTGGTSGVQRSIRPWAACLTCRSMTWQTTHLPGPTDQTSTTPPASPALTLTRLHAVALARPSQRQPLHKDVQLAAHATAAAAAQGCWAEWGALGGAERLSMGGEQRKSGMAMGRMRRTDWSSAA